jgi:ABC-2 type transport system permease protein
VSDAPGTSPAISLSRWPDATAFLTLLRREIYRWVVLPNQTIVPPVLNAALYVAVFGYAIGSRISEISGVSYIVYIFPGLVMMNVVNGAYANTTTSLFIARHELFVQDLLVSPLSYFEMALAYTLGGTIRGLAVGVGTLALGYAFLGIHMHHVGATLFFMTVSALACAAFGNIVGLYAERWDHVAIYLNYVLNPMIFLGGVFYSLKMLPEGWRTANLLNPIFHTVNGFRYGILGVEDVSPMASGAIGFGLFIVLFAVSVDLFRRGYKLRA